MPRKEGKVIPREWGEEQRPSSSEDSCCSVGGWCGCTQSKLGCEVVGQRLAKVNVCCLHLTITQSTWCLTVPWAPRAGTVQSGQLGGVRAACHRGAERPTEEREPFPGATGAQLGDGHFGAHGAKRHWLHISRQLAFRTPLRTKRWSLYTEVSADTQQKCQTWDLNPGRRQQSHSFHKHILLLSVD